MPKSGSEIVKCTVSNCEYWGQENNCTAEQILITAPASALPKVEKHGVGAEKMHETPIRKVEDSLCYTFEPRRK